MHQSYDASTEVTARTKTRSPRTYANTSESGLFFLECTPVLGMVPWLEPSETVKFGTVWETFFVPVDPASPCRARSQTVLLNRARFQIVLRDLSCRGRPALELDGRGIFSNFRMPQFLCETRLLECDCLLCAIQQARLPLNQGTALVEPSLSSELSG